MRIVTIARNTAIATLLLGLLVPGAASLDAQDAPLVDTQELDAAVLEHESSEDVARDRLGSFLAEPAVQEAAAANGIDLNRVERSVETLDADQVERLADAAEAARQSRTRITISASTIVLILLLVLILS